MLKLRDFECEPCQGTEEVLVEGDEGANCPVCDRPMTRIMSAPSVHTLETHMRGYRDDSDGVWRPGHGEFLDENLCDKAGNPQTYSSLSEKRKLLEKHGKFEKGPKPKNLKKRSERPMMFTGGGSKRSQLGINH